MHSDRSGNSYDTMQHAFSTSNGNIFESNLATLEATYALSVRWLFSKRGKL